MTGTAAETCRSTARQRTASSRRKRSSPRPAERERSRRGAVACADRNHSAKHLIFAKGSPGRSMMVVLSRQRQNKPTLRRPVGRSCFAILGAGKIFGEMALLDDGERTADATAWNDGEL